MTNEIQDTVHFKITAEHVIVNKTVKVVATVVALVAGETTEPALRSDIKDTMKKLIDADWSFSNMQRSADDSGWERVTLVASVRVDESENYNLENRAKDASRKGLSITDVQVDTSVPQAMIDEAESNLRIELIKKIKEEETKLTASIGGSEYRIHEISFGSVNNNVANTRSIKASSTFSNKMSYGTGFDDSDTLGNASKISMIANVILARKVH